MDVLDHEERWRLGKVVGTTTQTLGRTRHDDRRLHPGVAATAVGDQTQSCDATVGVACGPDLARSTRPDSGPLGAADALSTWSMTKLMSPGWFPMSPPSGPPGVPSFERGDREQPRQPRAAHAVSSCWYCWGSLPGRGRRQSAGTSRDPTPRPIRTSDRVPDGRHQGPGRLGWRAAPRRCGAGSIDKGHCRLRHRGWTGGASHGREADDSGPATTSRRPTISARIVIVRCIAPIPRAFPVKEPW